MKDNCPCCGTTAEARRPHYDEPQVSYRCSRCGQAWTAAYDPDAYEITDDSMPGHWADL